MGPKGFWKSEDDFGAGSRRIQAALAAKRIIASAERHFHVACKPGPQLPADSFGVWTFVQLHVNGTVLGAFFDCQLANPALARESLRHPIGMGTPYGKELIAVWSGRRS